MAHLPALRDSPYVDLVAVCDRDAARAEAARRDFGIPQRWVSVDDMLESADLDLVDVCTSNQEHFPVAMRAIAAGKHVLCEKPIGLNLAEAAQLERAAREARVLTAVGFTFRHSPAMNRFRQLIEEGYVGRIWHVQGFEQNSLYHDPNVPKPPNWLDRNSDVGVLGGYASHLIDLLRWTVGEFEDVAGHSANFVPARREVGREGLARCTVDDSSIFMATFAGGAHGVMQASWLAAGRPPGVEIRVYGDRGGLVVRLAENPEASERLYGTSIDDGVYHLLEVPADTTGERLGEDNWPRVYFRRLVDHLSRSVLDGHSPTGNFEDGLRCQQVIDAVTIAARERRWVKVAEVAPEPAAGMSRLSGPSA